jgi:hypothetical protein
VSGEEISHLALVELAEGRSSKAPGPVKASRTDRRSDRFRP